MFEAARDGRIRSAAFAFLDEQRVLHGDVLPWNVLLRGFDFERKRVPLVGPQGIFKPEVLDTVPLTILTVPEIQGRPRPYDDAVGEDGLLWYSYRGSNPGHHENVGLREAMRRSIPLIYLFGIVKGHYMPVYPVLIVGDQPERLRFKVDIDYHRLPIPTAGGFAEPDVAVAKRYALSTVRRRLHQQQFRIRVLDAYRERCAVCRLAHVELLDAAHIRPDAEVGGLAAVSNGLALCSLHHAAFDRYILGVRPDLVIEIRRDILDERDGPMLLHGLQGFDGRRMHVPRSAHLRPAIDLLDERYARFRKAS